MSLRHTIIRILRTSLLAVAVLLVVLVLGLSLWLYTFDLDSHRSEIEQLLSQSLDREVKIQGGLQSTLSLFPTVIASKVTIANPAWSSEPWLAEAETVAGSIALYPLLFSEIEIRNLELNNVKIHLETHADGTPNWKLGKASTTPVNTAALPSILHARINNLALQVKSQNRPVVNLHISRVDAAMPRNAPIELDAQFDYRDIPVHLALQGDTLTSLLSSDADWPINGSLSLPSLDLNVSGHLRDIRHLAGIGVRLDSPPQSAGELHVQFGFANLNKQYQIKLACSARNLNLSEHLQKIFHVTNIGGNIGAMQLDMQGQGANLDAVIYSTSAKYEIQNTDIQLSRGNGREPLRIRLDSLLTTTSPVRGITTRIKGALADIPVNINTRHDQIINLLWSNKPWPYAAEITVADTRVKVKGEVDKNAIHGALTLHSPDINKSLAYLDVSLPAIGQLKLAADYTVDHTSLRLENLAAQLLNSSLTGTASYAWRANQALEFALHSSNLDSYRLAQVFGASAPPELRISKLQLTNQQQLLRATATAQSKDLDFDLAFNTTALPALLTQDPLPYELHIQSGGTQLTATGNIATPRTKPALRGKLSGSVDDLARFSTLANLRLPPLRKLTLTADTRYAENSLAIDNLTVESKDFGVVGDARYVHGAEPDISAQLRSGHIEIAKFLPTQTAIDTTTATADTPPLATTAHAVPDTPVDLSLFAGKRLDVRFEGISTRFSDKPVNETRGHLTLANRILELELRDKSILGSTSLYTFHGDATTDTLKIDIKFNMRDFDYGDLLKRLGISQEVSGKFNTDIVLRSHGATTRELIANSHGNMEFVSDKGRIPRTLLELWGAGLLRILLPTSWVEDSTTELNCAVGRFVVDEGYLRSQTLLADTERVTVAGELAIDLKTEQISGLFKPQPKQATVFTLGGPIRVSGTLAHPNVSAAESGITRLGKWIVGLTSPTAMLLMFGDLGASEKNPCAALLKLTKPDESQPGNQPGQATPP